MAGQPRSRARKQLLASRAQRSETVSQSESDSGAAQPKRPLTNAERQARYRERKRLEREAAQRQDAVKGKAHERLGGAVPQTAEDRPDPAVAGSIPAGAPDVDLDGKQEVAAAAAGAAERALLGLPPAAPANVTPLRVVQRDADPATRLAANWDIAIELLTQGKWPGEVAKVIGVKLKDMVAWVDDDPDRKAQYARARQIAAEANLEEAERGLRDAKDNFTLTKARDLAYHLRWLAARRDPVSFGDKVDVTSGGKALLARPVEEIDAELKKILAKRAA